MSPITNYNRFLTPLSLCRKPSAIRDLQRFLGVPGMISLGGGSPHPSTFPFESLQFKLKSGSSISLTQNELITALQYSPTNGLPNLVTLLKDFQRKEHNVNIDESTDIVIGTGSQDVLTKAFDMLVGNGTILIEAPSYSGSLAYLKPSGCKFAEVDVDKKGLVPDSLESILEKWDDPETKPRVLYTIPVGGNPTGMSTSSDRKKRVYSIAQKHDLIILEDDPYYYLQFTESPSESYFSMDVDGRVLRFDSFSKILSSGVRFGFATGPKPLIDRIVLHSQATHLHTSGVSQMLVYKTLEEWGYTGFKSHTRSVTEFYKAKRDIFVQSAKKHLVDANVSFEVPHAGMFVWMDLGVHDTTQLVKEKALEAKILFVPGGEFYAVPRESSHVRASFSTATKQDIDTALQRLKNILEN